ncbi:MAG: DUF72 domain-containing protein [Micromonosporaceae bacterium]
MIRVGTSGWQYRSWRDVFYAGAPQRTWLQRYAEVFDTVEVNSAFYRLPERDVFTNWSAQTPHGFCFAVKMSRYLTHIRRLREPAEPVARFLDRAAGLGHQLGPVLLQLPPTLTVDTDALAAVLARFPSGLRVAVEPRHRSWWTPAVQETLSAHGAALCWADRLGRRLTPLWVTAEFGYLRLHEGRAQPRPQYGRRALAAWLGRVRAAYPTGAEVYVYFNNDHAGAAVANARTFAAMAAR